MFDQNGQYQNAICLEAQDSLLKAQELLKKHDYEACALYLRKKTEELLRIYFDPTLQELARYAVFEKLATTLNSVEKDVNQRLTDGFLKVLQNPHVTEERLKQLKSLKLISTEDMTAAQRRETGQTNCFKNDVFNYLIDHYTNNKVQEDKMIAHAKKLDEIRGRIMNAGAHADSEPLYRQELEEACKAVKEFEQVIKGKI